MSDTVTLYRVCGHDCFPNKENCNGYCDGRSEAPAAYEVPIQSLLNKASTKYREIDLLLLGASNKVTQLQQEKLELLAAIALMRKEMIRAADRFGFIACKYNERINGVHPSTGYDDLLKALAIQPDAQALSQYIEPLVKALEMIAGKRQCIDNLLSNQEIAQQTLAAFKREQK